MTRVNHLHQCVLSKIDALEAILVVLYKRTRRPKVISYQNELKELRTNYIINTTPILIEVANAATSSTNSSTVPSPTPSPTPSAMSETTEFIAAPLTIDDLLHEIITISTQVVYDAPCTKVTRPDPEIDDIPDIDKPAIVRSARRKTPKRDVSSEPLEYYKRLLREVHTTNVRGRLTRIASWCTRMALQSKPAINIDELVRAYEFYEIDDSVEESTDHICPSCNIPYFLDEKMSEFNCPKCGVMEPLYGEVFSDEQIMFHEGARVRNSSYAPSKHCKDWIDRIQAIETDTLPEELINGIRGLIKRDKIFFENISYKIIRAYLSELGMSKYNTNIPSIKKRITQKEQPQFTESELKQIYMYFSRVMQLLGKINTDKKNCSHHQFFIYKIVEQIMVHPKDRARRQGILNNIHLQSKKTLVRNDEIWAAICEHIEGFTATTTMPR